MSKTMSKTKHKPKRKSRLTAKAVGARIRQRRVLAGLTQGQFAKKIGMDRSNLCRLEGGFHMPDLVTVWKVASTLGVSIDKLLS